MWPDLGGGGLEEGSQQQVRGTHIQHHTAQYHTRHQPQNTNAITHTHAHPYETTARENVVTVGSAVLFNAPGTELYSNLGRGAEAWAGYRQAVKVTQNGLALVLDLAAGAFVKAGPLVEICAGERVRGGAVCTAAAWRRAGGCLPSRSH